MMASEIGLFPGRRKWQDASKHGWLKRHSLGLVLAAMLFVQTAHAIWAGHLVWISEGADHGKTLSGWPADFWVWWSWEYNVSLVADTFGVFLIVMLSKWLYEQGSSESEG